MRPRPVEALAVVLVTATLGSAVELQFNLGHDLNSNVHSITTLDPPEYKLFPPKEHEIPAAKELKSKQDKKVEPNDPRSPPSAGVSYKAVLIGDREGKRWSPVVGDHLKGQAQRPAPLQAESITPGKDRAYFPNKEDPIVPVSKQDKNVGPGDPRPLPSTKRSWKSIVIGDQKGKSGPLRPDNRALNAPVPKNGGLHVAKAQLSGDKHDPNLGNNVQKAGQVPMHREDRQAQTDNVARLNRPTSIRTGRQRSRAGPEGPCVTKFKGPGLLRLITDRSDF